MAYHSAELSVLGEFALVPAAAADAKVEGAIVRNGGLNKERRDGTEKRTDLDSRYHSNLLDDIRIIRRV
jgi:hypothetical protein